ncbi:hypothetical protein SDC9_139253 [bioreactor metagenome]|uniref:Uncharacterized protein n=1 Tax=bioreactor metagenome TaxID=1076179 RepID=A0A645DS69_9ZZZZ
MEIKKLVTKSLAALVFLIAIMSFCSCGKSFESLTDKSIAKIFSDNGITCEVNDFPKPVSENYPSYADKKILSLGNDEIYILRFSNEGTVQDALETFTFNASDLIFYKNDVILVYRGSDNTVIDILKKSFTQGV